MSILHHNSNVNANSKGLILDHVTWNATHLSILMETVTAQSFHRHDTRTLTKWRKEQIGFEVGVAGSGLTLAHVKISAQSPPSHVLLSALRVSGLDLWVHRLSHCLGHGVILFSCFFSSGSELVSQRSDTIARRMPEC